MREENYYNLECQSPLTSFVFVFAYISLETKRNMNDEIHFFFVNYPKNSKIIYRRRKLFFTAIKMWTTFTHIDVGCEKAIGSESKMVDIILIITIAKKIGSFACASSLFEFLFEKYARFLKMLTIDLDFFTVYKLSPIRFISKPFHRRIISS